MPVIRPGKAAISGSSGLLAALARVAEKHGLCMTRAQIREAVAEGANALRPLLGKLAERAAVTSVGQRSPTVLIAIDQAEELFQVEGNSESGRILTLLRDLASTDDPAIIILFATRTDSYDALEQEKIVQRLAPTRLHIAAYGTRRISDDDRMPCQTPHQRSAHLRSIQI